MIEQILVILIAVYRNRLCGECLSNLMTLPSRAVILFFECKQTLNDEITAQKHTLTQLAHKKLKLQIKDTMKW